MAANTVPIFPLIPRIETQQITDSDTTTKKLLFAPGTNGSRINMIGVNSDDSASATVNFYISKDSGSTFKFLGSIALTAGYQGTIQSGIPCFDLSLGMPLPYGANLYAAAAATITTGKTLSFSVIGSDY